MNEKASCSDCRKVADLHLLDAVLLDAEGREASEELYCEQCWPKHKVVADDMWRAANTLSERIEE